MSRNTTLDAGHAFLIRLVAALALLLCAVPVSRATEELLVSLDSPWPLVDSVAEEFEEAHGVRVRVYSRLEEAGSMAEEAKRRALADLDRLLGDEQGTRTTDSMPTGRVHILAVRPADVVRMARSSELLELDALVQQAGVASDRLEGELAPFRVEGRLLAFPIDDQRALAIRKGAPEGRAFEFILLARERSVGLPYDARRGLGVRLGVRCEVSALVHRHFDFSLIRPAEGFVACSKRAFTLHPDETIVEAFDEAGALASTYTLRDDSERGRFATFSDHAGGTVHTFPVPERWPGVVATIEPNDNTEMLLIALENGCILRAEGRIASVPSRLIARRFWHDIVWMEDGAQDGLLTDLAGFGVPRRLSLEDRSGTLLSRIEIVASAPAFERSSRTDGEIADLGSVKRLEGTIVPDARGPLTLFSSQAPAPGSHVEWTITAGLAGTLRKALSELLAAGGEFSTIDPADGSLRIDWMPRAEKWLGNKNVNTYTKTRELLKSMVALHLLPRELAEGKTPAELDAALRSHLDNILRDPAVPPQDRLCAFLAGLSPQTKEFSGKSPTPEETKAYRNRILLDLVNAIVLSRFGVLKIPKLPDFEYSCFAFDFKARDLEPRVYFGEKGLQAFEATDRGLRIDAGFERLEVDLDYTLTPSTSAANIALCLFTGGLLNLLELDAGPGMVTAKNVKLSFDLVPRTDPDGMIRWNIVPSDRSHATLEYAFYGVNIVTYLKMPIISTVMTLANAFEGKFLDAIGGKVATLVPELLPPFPEVFHFDDAPLLTSRAVHTRSSAGSALGLSAVFNLTSTTPSPPPRGEFTGLEKSSDFSIALDRSFLETVVIDRFERELANRPPPSLGWEAYARGPLPEVTLPAGYQRPGLATPFPADFEQVHESWEVSPPQLDLAQLTSPLSEGDPVGTVRISVRYRLEKARHAWQGHVREPDIRVPPWRIVDPSGRTGDPVARIADDPPLGTIGRIEPADRVQPRSLELGIPLLLLPHDSMPQSYSTETDGVVIDWSTYVVAADEHVSAVVGVDIPVHIEMRESVSFLPVLDLSYSSPQVTVLHFKASDSFDRLAEDPGVILKLVSDLIMPFSKQHPLQKTYNLSFLNVYPMCQQAYLAYRPEDPVVTVAFSLFSMLTMTSRVMIETTKHSLVVGFDFLGSF
ncbi:MAG: hypothetical protein AB1486_28570 [Planctomycetota bacterium]